MLLLQSSPTEFSCSTLVHCYEESEKSKLFWVYLNVWWSKSLSRTTSLWNNGMQFSKLFFRNRVTGFIMQHTATQKRLTAAAIDCISFPPASALHPGHFSGHLTDNRAPSIMSSFFHQRKVSYKMTSHTVTLCLVLDHQASASGSCAVSTKTDLIMKSKGDSNDILESIKLFLK